MSSSSPNFLIIMCEQFSALSDPNTTDFPVEAPNLKRFAETSVRFENAYCNAPVCGPVRMSFLSGRYGCNIDVFDNGSALPESVPTFAHMLTTAGYQTAMCGRMHYHGLDVYKGFEHRLAPEIHSPLMARPGDFPGAFDPIRPLEAQPEEVSYAPEFSDNPMYGHDEHISATACEFLKSYPQSDDQRPFCLTVGTMHSHPTGKPTPAVKELYDMYMAREELPIADFSPEEYENQPEHIKRLLQCFKKDLNPFSEGYQRHEMAWYMARVTYLDQNIGPIFDALDESGLDENTVVIFLADHGDGMGRHGLWGKMFFYEEAERVPFYIRLPGQKEGRVVGERACTVDILPTLADLAGCEIRFPYDGESLKPLLEGSREEEEGKLVFSEYHGYLSPTDMYMILKGDFKYNHYLKEPCELYNITADPQEMNNLIDDPQYADIIADARAELNKIVDIDWVERRVKEYNLQRQAIDDAFVASDVMRKRNLDFIEQHRKEMNSPWWDGGELSLQWEGNLYGRPKAPPKTAEETLQWVRENRKK
jgi:choline-sulfatase